jgi:hypothetical protein
VTCESERPAARKRVSPGPDVEFRDTCLAPLLFPATYTIHLAEEYFAGGGFGDWAARVLDVRIGMAEFLAWNIAGLALMCAATFLVSRHSRYRWIEMALAIAVLGNALGHLGASLATGTYSPGLFTALLIWCPLGTARLVAGWRRSDPRGRRAGIAVGLVVIAVTTAILAAHVA